MRRLLILGGAVVLSLPALQACARQNPLLGVWNVDQSRVSEWQRDHGGCPNSRFIFRPSSQTVHTDSIAGMAAYDTTSPVTYNTAAKDYVYVIGATYVSQPTKWRFVDANHIIEATLSNCPYVRAG